MQTDDEELALGTAYVANAPEPGGQLSVWEKYAQALLASNEFAFVD